MGAAAKSVIVERRGANRVNLGNVIARAELGAGNAPVTVCVWDLSLTGACVLVPPDMTVPDQFTILFEHASREARVVWRTAYHVGVSFVEPLQPSS